MELYKVLRDDGSACNGGCGKWHLPKGNRPGKWMPVLPVEMCTSGYHLVEASGILEWIAEDDNLVYRAEGRGEHQQYGTTHCYAQARLLGQPLAWNARVARLFACDCAEHVLPIFERGMPGDYRPRRWIEVSRQFARGEVEEAVRAAARAGAWAAGWDAVGAAVWYAAWAAAWDAAWYAARSAAWYAAVAMAADRCAAWEAEKEWQTARLLQYLHGEVT